MTQPSQTAAALAKQLAKSSTNPTHGLSVPKKILAATKSTPSS